MTAFTILAITLTAAVAIVLGNRRAICRKTTIPALLVAVIGMGIGAAPTASANSTNCSPSAVPVGGVLGLNCTTGNNDQHLSNPFHQSPKPLNPSTVGKGTANSNKSAQQFQPPINFQKSPASTKITFNGLNSQNDNKSDKDYIAATQQKARQLQQQKTQQQQQQKNQQQNKTTAKKQQCPAASKGCTPYVAPHVLPVRIPQKNAGKQNQGCGGKRASSCTTATPRPIVNTDKTQVAIDKNQRCSSTRTKGCGTMPPIAKPQIKKTTKPQCDRSAQNRPCGHPVTCPATTPACTYSPSPRPAWDPACPQIKVKHPRQCNKHDPTCLPQPPPCPASDPACQQPKPQPCAADDPGCVQLPPASCPAGDTACQQDLLQQCQQALHQQAEAQAAADQQFQQELLKALLEQAVIKSGSTLLSQRLSGKTSLTPADIAQLITDGTLTPPDLAAAYAQAAQQTGEHFADTHTDTSACTGGNAENPDSGKPQASAANTGPNPQNQPQGQNSGKSRVTDPVAGLWDSIDPKATFPNWEFFDPYARTDPASGVITVETEVTFTKADGTKQEGYISRAYDPKTSTLTFDQVRLDAIDEAERWIPTTPEMVSGRGTPLETYLTMRQMKLIEQEAGKTVFDRKYNVHMSAILNAETMLELARSENLAKDAGVPFDRNTAVLDTSSIKYAGNSITQSGGVIDLASVQVSGGRDVSAAEAASSFRNIPLDPGAYGIAPGQQVLKGFDIDFTVTPRPGGIPHLPLP